MCCCIAQGEPASLAAVDCSALTRCHHQPRDVTRQVVNVSTSGCISHDGTASRIFRVSHSETQLYFSLWYTCTCNDFCKVVIPASQRTLTHHSIRCYVARCSPRPLSGCMPLTVCWPPLCSVLCCKSAWNPGTWSDRSSAGAWHDPCSWAVSDMNVVVSYKGTL